MTSDIIITFVHVHQQWSVQDRVEHTSWPQWAFTVPKGHRHQTIPELVYGQGKTARTIHFLIQLQQNDTEFILEWSPIAVNYEKSKTKNGHKMQRPNFTSHISEVTSELRVLAGKCGGWQRFSSFYQHTRSAGRRRLASLSGQHAVIYNQP
jgi:hypothetical protein